MLLPALRQPLPFPHVDFGNEDAAVLGLEAAAVPTTHLLWLELSEK